MGGNDVFSRIALEVKERVIARDKRRCCKCQQYFGEHRPMYVIVLDSKKPETDERNLAAICSSCSVEYEASRRSTLLH